MKMIKNFATLEYGDVVQQYGTLRYKKVQPIWTNNPQEVKGRVPGSCFLYDDYAACLTEGEVFYEITHLEIMSDKLRQGYGTALIKEFMEKQQPTSICLRAGVLSEKLYNSLEEKGELMAYILENIVPFWESLGFTNVNGTVFSFEQCVPMLWPVEKAELASKLAKEFREQMDKDGADDKEG